MASAKGSDPFFAEKRRCCRPLVRSPFRSGRYMGRQAVHPSWLGGQEYQLPGTIEDAALATISAMTAEG